MPGRLQDLKRLEPDQPRPEFNCGDPDLNDFFTNDSIVSDKQLLSVTYLALDENGEGIAFFSVSNDSVKKESSDIAKNRWRNISPQQKRFSSMPAVKIGRLATRDDLQGQGIGSEVMDFIKFWFTQGNKTGCKFILVDAYNDTRVLQFYKDNGFDFLVSKDQDEKTRLMYFDLITFRPE